IFDNFSGKLYVVAHHLKGDDEDRARVEKRLGRILDALESPLPRKAARGDINHVARQTDSDGIQFVSGLTQAGYEAAVVKIREYTQAGDVMQVVPSQRLSAPFNTEPMSLYRALRSLNPSPYMY